MESRATTHSVFGDGFSPSVGRPEIIRENRGVSSKGRFSVAISSQPGSLIKSTIDEDKNETMERSWEIRLRHVTTQKMKLHDVHGFIEFFCENAVEAHSKYSSAEIHHPIFPPPKPPKPPRPLHRGSALPCLPVLLLIRQDLLAVTLCLLALGFSIWIGRFWQGINKP